MFGLRLASGIFLGWMSLLSQPLHAEDQDYAAKAAALVEPYVKSNLFTGAVLVAKDGKPVFEQAFGLANREWNIPNGLDTKFRIGSITKQFTAAAILQLAAQGKLDLDDPIARYYPGAPSTWAKITLKHLLTHTSGIPNATSLPDFFKTKSKLDMTPQEAIGLTQNMPLEFEPGAQFSYDNTGYVLLGLVIEKASGETYAHYLQAHIFDPLGMHETGIDDSRQILQKRASGYAHASDTWSNAPYLSTTLPYAAGGLYSTINDLSIWDQGLANGKVLDATSLKAMFTDYGHNYGFGWYVRSQFNHSLQSHGGSINGFRSIIDRYPDDGLVIIVLSNLESSPVEKIGVDLAALYFGVSQKYTEVPADPALLDHYVGRYQLAPRFILTISREGDRLFSQATGQEKVEIFAKGARDFFLKVADAQLTFKDDINGHASALVLHQNGRDFLAPRVE